MPLFFYHERGKYILSSLKQFTLFVNMEGLLFLLQTTHRDTQDSFSVLINNVISVIIVS